MTLLLAGGFPEPWRQSAEPDHRKKEYLSWPARAADKRALMLAGRGGKLRSSFSCHQAVKEQIPDHPGLRRARGGATARTGPSDRRATEYRCWRWSAAFFFLPGQMPF